MAFSPQIQLSEVDQFSRKVTITVPQAQVSQAFSQRFDQLNKNNGVPGFRKGKAPVNMLRQKFGQQVAFEIHDRLINDGWKQAIVELNLAPVTQPELQNDRLASANSDFSFSLTFEVAPTINLAELDWKSIEVNSKDWQLSDERLDAEIQQLAKRNGEWTETSAPSANGHQVSFSLEGVIDGLKKEELSSPDEKCILGKGELLAEIEAALTGKSAGESFSVSVDFPADSNSAFAGKSATFSGSVNSVSEQNAISIEDLIVKLKVADLEELKQRVSEALKSQYQQQSKQEARKELTEKLKSFFSFDVPTKLLAQQISNIEEHHFHHDHDHDHEHGEDCDHDHDHAHHHHGHVHTADCGHEIDPKMKQEALEMLRMGFVSDQIVEDQQISVADAEVNRMISQILMSTNFNMELFNLYQQEGPRRRLKESLIEEKVLDWILTQVSVKSEVADIPAIEI